MHNYKELEVWKESIKFCPEIYKLVRKLPEDEKFGLISQLKRAVISIPSNIAEGSAKSSDKHFVIFLENSLGSCYEIETQLQIAFELQMINKETFSTAIELAKEVNRMIYALKSKLIS